MMYTAISYIYLITAILMIRTDMIKQQDEVKKIEILAHAREQNGTKLGYGNGHNGKGNTAQGGSKPATLDGGAVVNVPFFIQVGDVLRIDTRTNEYLDRV